MSQLPVSYRYDLKNDVTYDGKIINPTEIKIPVSLRLNTFFTVLLEWRNENTATMIKLSLYFSVYLPLHHSTHSPLL